MVEYIQLVYIIVLLTFILMIPAFLYIVYQTLFNRKKVDVFQTDEKIIVNKDKTEYELDYNDIKYYNGVLQPESSIDNFITNDSSFVYYGNNTTSLKEQIGNIFQPGISITQKNISNKEPLKTVTNNVLYTLDKQNVHDSFIQDTIKDSKKYMIMPYNIENFSDEQIYDDITTSNPEISEMVKMIKNRNTYISNLDLREFDILKNVWITGKDNENIKNELIFQLKDSLKNSGGLYCPTGIASRLVTALYIENPEKAPKSKQFYKEEVLNKFSELYKQHNYDENYKNNIKEVILSDYDYNKNLQKDISKLIDDFIEHV